MVTSSDLNAADISISVDRTSLYEGGETKFVSKIFNDDAKTFLIEVLDQIPHEIRISEGGNHYLVALQPRAVKSVHYKLRCEQKGHLVLKPSRIRLLDPFGLKHKELERGNSVFLKVLPITEEIKGFRLTPKSVHLTLGAAKSKRPGVGTEFFSLREYLPGDEFRRINWKASARSRRLMANEYEWEQVVDVYLLLDATTSSPGIFGASVRAAASLANNLVKGRNRVGLIIYSDTIGYVQAEAGGRQLLKILDKLIDARAGEPFVFEAQISATTRLILPYSYAILISPLVNQKILVLLEKLKEFNLTATVVSPSPLSEPASIAFDEPVRELAHEILVLGRQSLVANLREKGIDVVDWDPSTSLRQVMGVLIKRPIRS